MIREVTNNVQNYIIVVIDSNQNVIFWT